MPVDRPLDLERLLGVLDRRAEDRCLVAPSPELGDRIKAEVERLNASDEARQGGLRAVLRAPRRPGFNDGLIIPGSYFPLGTSVETVRSAAAQRSPLHGTLNVAVVLIDFDDRPMTQPASHFEELFFSEGVLTNGSVREYFTDVTNGLVTLTGDVVGPYRLPRDMAEYANGDSGTGMVAPNARTMANDAVTAADPDIDFGPYDNDGNGFVDAFVVVHAGSGAEQTGSVDDIWSHKWVLPAQRNVDSTKIYAYLTVPEDARIGVCAHELGHLLFGLPDLYDIDNTSEGIGNWCLMAGGSWGGGGDTPVHPSAWCKAQQEWVTVQNVTTNGSLSIADVKDSHTVYRLWKDGAAGQEYFLVENRQADRRDVSLPGGGLLIWHVDEAISNNSDEAHYKVALKQADGDRDMENNVNRGDGGDCYPGSTDNRTFDHTSTPSSKSYGGLNTCVVVSAISDAGPVMTADVKVQCVTKSPIKDFVDGKGRWKDVKEPWKEGLKDLKEPWKERIKDGIKEKDGIFDKWPEKPATDKAVAYDKPPFTEKVVEGKPMDGKLTDGKVVDGKLADGKLADGKLTDGKPADGGFELPAPPDPGALERRLAALEAAVAALTHGVAQGATPFIGAALRPDLRQSALLEEPDGTQPSGPVHKRSYDAVPPAPPAVGP
jgi:immune inhibitor A